MSKAWGKGSTRAWRRIRARVLLRDGYACKLRIPGVCTEHATQVHHTRPREDVGDDPRYLMAACARCNNAMGDPRTPPTPRHRRVTRW